MTGPKRVTEKQLAANRANARKSTGPRTPQGKAIASRNAVKHGILSQAVIPRALDPFESRADFDQLLEELTEAYAPDGIVEELLVQQIAVAYWRLARLYRAEAGDIALQNRPNRFHLRPSPRPQWAPLADPDSPEGLQQQRTALDGLLGDGPAQRAALRAALVAREPDLAEATDAQLRDIVLARIAAIDKRLAEHERHRQDVRDACHSFPRPDTALKFARYETALQRQLDRALSRLERTQRRRGAEPAAPSRFLSQIDTQGDR